ncbi:MAG: DNA gyrase subunit B, partial [Deltaproteobacteria bacterium]|nr:DNA gyrase subunit B [Deltaproteobacteria bacterium]
HIRTLLLTFFYRQMPELIEKGYLYIAQPPLFRVGKGKKGTYLKDEEEYSEYLLKRICDNKSVKNDNDTKISEQKLYSFMVDLSEYLTALLKLEKRGFNSKIVELLTKKGVNDKTFLQNKDKMSDLKDMLSDKGYDVAELTWNEERSIYELMVKSPENNIGFAAETVSMDTQPVKIGRSLICSMDFQNSLVLNKKILNFDHPPFSVFNKDNEEGLISVENKKDLYLYMMEEGKKGISIQRYKGLGEMNPNQLWETTMDPEMRIMLQVKVEDAVEADEIFTLLMGDEVEPRRNFIQSNALEVEMLDI